jgi:hypothetical protein
LTSTGGSVFASMGGLGSGARAGLTFPGVVAGVNDFGAAITLRMRSSKLTRKLISVSATSRT